jgi:hypothetical protein
MAGNGPEGRVVDRRGVWWTGRASGRMEMSERGISGPESVAGVNVRLRHSWGVKSAKRGLSVCSVEGPLTPGPHTSTRRDLSSRRAFDGDHPVTY